MARITCERCGQLVEVTEEQADWMTMCKKCFAITKKEEKEQQSPKQKEMTEFKKGTDAMISLQQDVELFNTIRELLEGKLGRELKEGEHGWVSTIYIQRKRSM